MILPFKAQSTSSQKLDSFPMTAGNSNHRFHSPGNVPFSWENSPGITKAAPRAADEGPVVAHDSPKIELPPPPCTDDSPRRRPVGRHGIHVPLPPVPFQSTASRHAPMKRDDDPFLAAYKECTKSVKKKEGKRGCNSGKEGVKRSSGSWWGLSCKQGSGGVRDDGIVRV